MTITIVISVLSLICTIIIAWNNYFGLRERFKNYMRKKLEVPTEKEKLDKKRLENDRKLFEEITSYLDSDGNMMEVRDQHFGAAFRDNLTDDLREFVWQCKKPEFEFHDEELETLKVELRKNMEDFLNAVGKHTFTNKVSPSFRSVPKDWSHRHPDKYKEVISSINEKADLTIQAYDNFIRKCRSKLAV